MERKLIGQGGGGYTIYLPKKWVEKNNLDKGNLIDVREDENKLVIEAKASQKQNNAVIDVTNIHPLVNRSLIALYVKGVDEICVKFQKKEEILDFQKRIVPELIGFEIVKQSSNEIVLRDITGTGTQEIDDLIKRIFLIIDSIFEELIISIEKRKGFEELAQSDSSVNRLCHFCLRILNKKGYSEYNKTTQIYGIINLLEEIGDDLKKIILTKNKSKFNKRFAVNISESRKMLDNFKDLLYDFSKEKAALNAKIYIKIKKELIDDSLDNQVNQLIEDIIKINNYLLVFSLGKE